MSRSKKRNKKNQKKQTQKKQTTVVSVDSTAEVKQESGKNSAKAASKPANASIQSDAKNPTSKQAEPKKTTKTSSSKQKKPSEATVPVPEKQERGEKTDKPAEPTMEKESTSATTQPKSEPAQSRKKLSVLTWLKNIALIGIKVIVLISLIAGAWVTLTPYFRIDRNKDGDYMRNLPENTIDVLALGSSHMQYAFNPGVFYAETGKYSYVFGSVCQPFSESYYLLKEVLKTQTPEVVLIDVFTLLPQSQVCYADGTYYIAMDMMSGENRIDAAQGIPETVDEETALGYKMDLYMNHGNWKTMDLNQTEEILKNGQPEEGYAWELGYVAQKPEVFQYTPLEVLEPETVTPLTESEKEWIDKIVDLCKENKIHLIFLKTPYIENQEDANKLAGIWDYLDQKQVEYIDFLRKAEELDWFLDMDGDTWHNNTWGAEIITKELARVIEESGSIQHHSANEEADLLYDAAKTRTAGYLMDKENINIYRLMEEASKYPCTILFRYQGKSRSSIGEYENNALQALGLNHDFQKNRNQNYYAVIQNGTIIEEGDKPFATELNGKTIEITAGDILLDGASVGSNGELQIVFCDNNYEWINPIGINYSSASFWKAGCNGWACEATGQ